MESKTPISKTIYDTDEIKKKIDDSLQHSDLLAFGRYSTGYNGESGENIWRVIAVEEDQILLLSEYLLDARQFHEEIEEVFSLVGGGGEPAARKEQQQQESLLTLTPSWI